MKKDSVNDGIEPMFTPDELQAALKLPSKSWIYSHVHYGTLPFEHVKVGAYLRFPIRAVRAYLESQTKKSG